MRDNVRLPGGDPRCHLSIAPAVLLPLKNLQAPSVEAEVLACGGAQKGSFALANNCTFVRALDTCGRFKITGPNPLWVLKTIPQARVMSDMSLLPNGNVLIIKGGAAGTASWKLGRNPVLKPLIYCPNGKVGSRFELQNPVAIPRMYHSTTILLHNGCVLVGGSNPHEKYKFKGVLYPTELSLEAFSLAYLDPENSRLRPKIIFPSSQVKLKYKQNLVVLKVHGGKNCPARQGVGDDGGAVIHYTFVFDKPEVACTWKGGDESGEEYIHGPGDNTWVN